MDYKKIISFIFCTTSLFLICGTVFALEVSWPTIGNLSIKNTSSIGDTVKYFFALSTAAGSVIMFGMIISGGIDFIFAKGEMGKISRARTKIIGSAIGMIVLLSIFVILNNINPALLSPENIGTECVNGIKRKVTKTYTDSKGEKQENIIYQCINSNQPDLTVAKAANSETDETITIEDQGSTYPLCFMREVITFPEKNYKGEKTVIFKDDTINNDNCPAADSINLGDAKSFKFMLKQDGIYLYGGDNTLPECGEDHLSDKDPPTELCDSSSTSSDLTEETDGHWTWKCKKNDSDIEISCRTTINPECGTDHLSDKDPPTELCNSSSTSKDLTEETDGHWTWKCKGEGSSNIEVSCRTLIPASCGTDHLTHNNPPTNLCESPSTSSDLTKKDNGSYTWQCNGEKSNSSVSCRTLYPAGCTFKSEFITNGVSQRPPDGGNGGTVDVTTKEFNWDGVTDISISSDGTEQDNFIFLDDSLLIENLSNGKSILFSGTDHRGTNIGDPSIKGILQKGSNTLKYTAIDSDNDAACTGIGTLYLTWCEKYSEEQASSIISPTSASPMTTIASNPISSSWPIFGESTDSTNDKKLGPFFYNTNVENFDLENFNDKVKKIEFVSKNFKKTTVEEISLISGSFYGAVLFSNPSFSGKCFYVSPENGDLTKKDKATGEDIVMSGDLSSMIIFKAKLTIKTEADLSNGSVDLYATPNCGEDDIKTDDTGHKYDVCSLAITPTTAEYLELEKIILGQSKSFIPTATIDPDYVEPACADKFLKKDRKSYYDIQSFRINGSAGVVLKTDKGNCHYFDVKTNPRRGNCFANLQDTFKSFLGQEKVKTIMIIPLEQAP
ncbi:MAG: pilin [Candidatus Paceibacterota bacterium]